MNREINGVDADRSLAEMTPSEMRVYNAAGEAIEKIMNASPQARVKRAIETAALRECASDDGRIQVANAIVSFANFAAEFLEHGDFRALESAIGEFERRVNSAAQITPPRPALIPDGVTLSHFGWSSAHRANLQDVLGMGMCGVIKGSGDYVVKIDIDGVTLSSGLRLSKPEIIAACVPASRLR